MSANPIAVVVTQQAMRPVSTRSLARLALKMRLEPRYLALE
jgi:hypothetical protein